MLSQTLFTGLGQDGQTLSAVAIISGLWATILISRALTNRWSGRWFRPLAQLTLLGTLWWVVDAALSIAIAGTFAACWVFFTAWSEIFSWLAEVVA